MQLFYCPTLSIGLCTLDADESHHAVRVLRRREGDEIFLTDGLGHLAHGIIAHAAERECLVSIDRVDTTPTMPPRITLAVAPTKNPARMEWLVEKAVEVGVERIVLLQCDHSERTFLKTDRLQKVAFSAMKQSLHTTLPTIVSPTPLRQWIGTLPADTLRLVAHCEEGQPRLPIARAAASGGQDIVVLIGPEGDFSPQEIALCLSDGWKPVSLGPSRLRTETAALYALVAIHTAFAL